MIIISMIKVITDDNDNIVKISTATIIIITPL